MTSRTIVHYTSRRPCSLPRGRIRQRCTRRFRPVQKRVPFRGFGGLPGIPRHGEHGLQCEHLVIKPSMHTSHLHVECRCMPRTRRVRCGLAKDVGVVDTQSHRLQTAGCDGLSVRQRKRLRTPKRPLCVLEPAPLERALLKKAF